MAKRALLIGCNYPGTEAELQGCVNDVARMRASLIERFGFDERDIVVMIDTDENYPQPTGANIRKALKKIVANTDAGDILFMHFSGHGTRIPPESGTDEDTGYDECIVPTDMNVLSDDDFRELVNELPDGVTFTFISDSCHSGGLIDHEKEQIGDSSLEGGNDNENSTRTREFHLPGFQSEGREENERREGSREEYGRRHDYGRREEYDGREEYDDERRRPDRRDERREDGYGRSEYGNDSRSDEYERREEHGHRRESDYGRPDNDSNAYGGETQFGRSRDVKTTNRGLPIGALMSLLSSKTGKDVGDGGVRTALYSVFGEESSPMVQMFIGVLMSQAPAILASFSGQEEEKSSGGFGGLLSSLTGGGNKSSNPLGGMLTGVAMNFVKSQMTSARELGTDDILSMQTQKVKEVAESGSREWAFAGWKPEKERLVRGDMGILVSGCQTDETSADAAPSGGGAAYGALSNAIQTVLAEHEGPITCRELVLKARRSLKQGGFTQNPGLYCSDSNVHNNFICP